MNSLTPQEYERHLENQLCWRCHHPTSRSHARQRQCPKCRKKWSYARLQQEWRLLAAFLSGRTAYRVARSLKVADRTVRAHFARFVNALRGSRAGEDFLSATSQNECLRHHVQIAAKSLVFSWLILPKIQRHWSTDATRTTVPQGSALKSSAGEDFLLVS